MKKERYTNWINGTRRPVIACLAALLAGACAWGDDDMLAKEKGNGEALVTLALSVPAAGSPASRAVPLSLANEVAVNNVIVLLFKPGDDTFYYRALATGSAISDVTASPSAKKTFNVKLPVGTFNAVLLANAAPLLAGITPQTGITTRADIIDALVKELAIGAVWEEELIPMWGYIDNLEIDDDTDEVEDEIPLTRAIARVNVSVASDVQGVFELTDVYLYNYNRAGTLAPGVVDNSGYNTDQWDASVKKAKAPHLPTTITGLKQEGPLHYPAGDPAGLLQTIYTFEATKGAVNTKENTCLVVGGIYTGGAYTSNTGKSYYRVEFANDGSPDPTFLHLLRNHSYEVVIRGVTGPGYPTAGDAYNAKPVNIVVSITAWNDGDLKETTFNGQYELSVDKSALKFYVEGAAKSLLVYTDYPGGWTVEEAGLPSWLTVTAPTPSNGVARGDAGVITTLTLVAAPDGTLPRSGEFYIVAGNLRKKITVTQTGEGEFSLEVSPSELRFYKTPAGPKPISVISYPLALERVFSDAGTITWSEFPSLTGTSTTSYLFQPAQNPGSTTLGNTVLVKVEHDGQVLVRPVIVTQLGRDMIHDLVPANPYPPVAGDYTFTVVSEEPWRLGIETNPDGMMTLPATEDGVTLHPAVFAPYTYTFMLAGMTGGYMDPARQAVIRLYSPELPPAGVPYTIVQSGAPYITITDPASKVIDFGSGAGDRTATFKTNAGWNFTTDGDFSRVVADARSEGSSIMPIPPDNGTTVDQVGGVSATDVHEGSVVFTPVDISTAMGGEYETVVTFSTVNGGAAFGAPVGTDQLTIKRNVPVIWNFLSYNPQSGNVPAATDVTVTLEAETNVSWWGQRGDNTATRVNETVTARTANSTLDVTLPARPTDDPDSWTTGNNLTTTIKAGHGTTTGATINYVQPPYTLAVTAVNGGTGDVTGLDRAGATLPVTFSTDAPIFHVQLKNGDGNLIGDIQTFNTGPTPTASVQQVQVPLNDEVGTTRELEIWNAYGGKLWSSNITQNGYDGFVKVVRVDQYNLATYECPDEYREAASQGEFYYKIMYFDISGYPTLEIGQLGYAPYLKGDGTEGKLYGYNLLYRSISITDNEIIGPDGSLGQHVTNPTNSGQGWWSIAVVCIKD